MKKVIKWVLRVLMWLVIIGLFLGYTSPFINPNTIDLFAFFGLTFQAWLIAAIILLIVVALLKVKKWHYLALALIPSLLFIKRHYGFGTSANQDTINLRVVSFNSQGFGNGRYPNTSAQIDSFLSSAQADVAVIHEFRRSRNFMKYPEMPHRTTFMHSANAGIKVVSRHKIINRQKIEMPETDSDAGYVDILVKGDTFRVFALHLESNRLLPRDYHKLKNVELDSTYSDHALSLKTRLSRAMKKRAEQALIIQTELQRSPFPTIICSDLNATPMSYAYQKILKGKLDAFSEAGSGIGATYRKPFEILRIDYILYDPFFTCQLYGEHDEIMSDHKLIFAAFSYQSSE